MKFWFLTRPLPNYTNPNRIIPSNTLHARHLNCFLISRTHLPRRQLWLIHPLSTRKRSLYILHLSICPHWTWPILWFLYIPRNMKHWCTLTINSHSYCIRRLRSALRTNIILRRNRHHQPLISNPLYRHYLSRMNLRWIFRRQSNINTLFRLPLYSSIHHHSISSRSPTIPTRNRIQQPHRNPIQYRHNPIPPLLYNQRHPRRLTLNLNLTSINPIRPRPTRRP